MIIKASNKITIVEQKKIEKIIEWYLATEQNTDVTRETAGWTQEIQTITAIEPYLWNYEEVVYSLGLPDVSDPVIIGTYGGSGASLQIKYISSETMPIIVNNDVSAWSDTVPAPESGKKVYMTQKMSNTIDWSIPIQISATDGKDGEASVEINSDGYWVINGELTEVKAEGKDGKSPEITIGEDGYWYINGNPTGTRAEGDIGKDGASIEYVYYRSENSEILDSPYYNDNGELPEGWTESPQGITNKYKYEYVSVRQKPSGEDWGSFSIPVLWSKWGEKGQDGDGVYYEYYLSNLNEIPEYSMDDPNWTDEPRGVSEDYPYEYVVQIRTTYVNDVLETHISIPSLWAKYGEKGSSLQIKYINSKTTPIIIDNDVSAWSDNIPIAADGENIYMTQKTSSDVNWSSPIQISSMSAPTIEIIDGYWYVDGEPTNIKAEGENGNTPEITIGENGNWYINGVDSESQAVGPAGKDGANIEYVYYRNNTGETPNTPSYDETTNTLTEGWSLSPVGIEIDMRYEFVSIRTKPSGSDVWLDFSSPVIWSMWGEKGQDGDGVYYEYYLSDMDKVPTYSVEDPNWTDEPTGVSKEYPYEYVIQIKVIDGNHIHAQKASLWARYGETGASLQIKYINSATVPTIIDNNVSDWHDTVPTPEQGKKTYMTQKLSTDTQWSTPIQISGTDGEANVSINEDGYWIINGENTGVKAKGENGEAPEITIGEDGYWYIDGQPTTTKAEGEAGKDGADIEFVYYRNNNGETPTTPSYNDNNQLTTDWSSSPQGIDKDHMYEFVSVRTKQAGSTTWSVFSTPVIWSKWGEKGQDGDGVEYKYCLWNSSTTKPSYPTPSGATYEWEDDPKGVDKDNPYEYVVQIKTTVVDGVATTITSNVSLWAKYGADGKGISSITNYYTTTTSTDDTPSNWGISVPELTPENKYLWNYEYILYTDGTSTTTTPAIIGAYGDSGANGIDAIDFQIYSVDGFEFNDTLTSITLKTVAISGGSVISSGATYQWYWWNSLSSLSDKYEIISDETSSSLVVDINDAHALAGLKCEMTYGGITYTDYVSLTEKTVFYTSFVKFFDGSNIFTSNDLYIVAYVDLYKNNERIESALDYANTYCTGISTVSQTGVITSGLNGSFTNGDTMYFICENGNGYDVILGQYTSGSWKNVNHNCKYTYVNTLYSDYSSNIVAISKESVNRSRNIDFIVYYDNAELTRTSVNIIDSNDPIIGDQEPINPSHNQLWLDTSVTPNILKIYDHSTSKWLECTDYTGNTIYTSRPSSYSKGDLWILADGEVCNSFGPGSMLKATTSSDTFNESHWVDADESLTSLKENIHQYFEFNSNTGLKIGQKDEKFYVNISSQEMGFYDNSNNQNQKVVSISNNAAAIKGLTVENSAQFDCDATFNNEVNFFGFVFKKEQNGSLSLAIGT